MEYLISKWSERTLFVPDHHMMCVELIISRQHLGALILTAIVEPILVQQHCKIRSNSIPVVHVTRWTTLACHEGEPHLINTQRWMHALKPFAFLICPLQLRAFISAWFDATRTLWRKGSLTMLCSKALSQRNNHHDPGCKVEFISEVYWWPSNETLQHWKSPLKLQGCHGSLALLDRCS